MTDRVAFREVSADGVDAIFDDPAALEEPGFYAVVCTFEGTFVAARMRNVRWYPDRPWEGWQAPHTGRQADVRVTWASSLDETAYRAAVERVRRRIEAGEVYQANICRVLSRPVADAPLDELFTALLVDNPARYASRIQLDSAGVDIASASPELYLRRDGKRLASAPIKGTAPTADAMLAKDAVENIMITDLVRNDLQTVCEAGTVAVEGLLAVEQHPGLVHLVSTVVGQLRDDQGWSDVFAGTFPPGSVSGAPKSSAVQIIDELEDGPRGPYCGALGWVFTPTAAESVPTPGQTRTSCAELAVGIRTFWRVSGGAADPAGALGSSRLLFGAGAGITYDSDPAGEWRETELKAHKLLSIADRTCPSVEES